MEDSRYQGKPLLRLLEFYVLNAIGELTPRDAEVLISMQPKLAQVYGVEGSWDKIIATVMGFPDDMPLLIQAAWKRNSEIAASNLAELTAQKFSAMFVDENFLN